MNGKKLRNTILKYGITLAVGAVMAYAMMELHGLWEADGAAERYKILCDAFTIPGVVLALSAVLVFVSNEGIFHGITYALTYAVRMLIPGAAHKGERYGDYVERRREKGPIKHFGFLVITGAFYLALALVFMVLFYTTR